MTIESAKKELAKLISDYEEHREQYREKGYDEIKFRNNIVNRFFKIFDWDVDNTENLPEYNRDVIIHYKLKGKKSTTKPDYAFGLLAELKPLFFVEAKTPSTLIKDHKDSAHQIRRYGNSAGLAVSILTNFDEFAVYDCTKSPKQSDGAGYGRIEYFSYTQYLDNFDFFWNTFSKEAVKKGKFEKYIQTDTQKKGSVPPDKGFVEKLNEWREDLATSIGLNNKRLTEEDINYAVQLIIDRIIFLRFCEDKNIEHFGSLKEAAQKGITHQNLVELYHKADQKYNSGLFDFEKDTITPQIKIDNKILKNIIEELYRPKTEYEFGVMPVEILGNAYEQFLGHIIKIMPSGKAKIVEKPEVKKAGGVFYTPQYIVEYIVENTVGKLIEGKTPAQISKIKIVDPACGSGSFLLGAFICLLKYHSEYYWKKGLHKKKSKNSPVTTEGKLTVTEKKRIIINNLFGVDIDPNAVEVTKLSLLLKAMDGETEESIYQQFKMFHERALPDLDDNIKCGNSLIGHDFFGGTLQLHKEERKELEKKLKPFDWKTAFPGIFKQGGFDAVIGNPPYVDSEEMVKTHKETRNYCVGRYETAKGNWDMYCVFSERALTILKWKGFFGYIIPNKFLSAPYGEHLKKIFSKFSVKFLDDYSSVSVFVSNGKKVNVYPIVITINKSNTDRKGKYYKMIEEDGILKCSYEKDFIIKQNDTNWTDKFDLKELLIKKVANNSVRLSTHFHIESAATVAESYEIKKIIENRKKISAKYFAFINTGTIDRYANLWGIEKTQYIKNSYTHPVVNKVRLKNILPNRLLQSSSEKLILAGMVKQLEAVYDSGMVLAGKSTTIIRNKSNLFDLKYLLGLLNSKLYSLIFISRNQHNAMAGGYINVNQNQLFDFPFKEIHFKKQKEKSSYSEIVRLVDTLLELNLDLRKVKRPDEKDRLQNHITHSENRIDEIIYELYRLTKKEKAIIKKNLPK